VQRARLTDELSGLAALRARATTVAADERILELPLAALKASPPVRGHVLETLLHAGVGRSARGAPREADCCHCCYDGPETAPDHACDGLPINSFVPRARPQPAAEVALDRIPELLGESERAAGHPRCLRSGPTLRLQRRDHGQQERPQLRVRSAGRLVIASLAGTLIVSPSSTSSWMVVGMALQGLEPERELGADGLGPDGGGLREGHVLVDAVVGAARGHRGEVEAVEIGEEAVEVLGVGVMGGTARAASCATRGGRE
jgi:hypothetical protein